MALSPAEKQQRYRDKRKDGNAVTPPTEPVEQSRLRRPLGQDPKGWKPGHGPDSGRPCCKHFLWGCYDVYQDKRGPDGRSYAG